MEKKENISYFGILNDINNNFSMENLTPPIEQKLRELKQLLEDQFGGLMKKSGKSGGGIPLWQLRGLPEDPDLKLSEQGRFLKDFKSFIGDLAHLSHSYDVDHDLENNPKVIALVDELSRAVPVRPVVKKTEPGQFFDLNSFKPKG